MVSEFPAHHTGVESGNIHISPRKAEKFFQYLQLNVRNYTFESLPPNRAQINECGRGGDVNEGIKP